MGTPGTARWEEAAVGETVERERGGESVRVRRVLSCEDRSRLLLLESDSESEGIGEMDRSLAARRRARLRLDLDADKGDRSESEVEVEVGDIEWWRGGGPERLRREGWTEVWFSWFRPGERPRPRLSVLGGPCGLRSVSETEGVRERGREKLVAAAIPAAAASPAAAPAAATLLTEWEGRVGGEVEDWWEFRSGAC